MAVGLITRSPIRLMATRTGDLLVSYTEHSPSVELDNVGPPAAVWTLVRAPTETALGALTLLESEENCFCIED